MERERLVPLDRERRLRARIGRELRRHRLAYAVLLAFVLAGPLVTHMIFPEASPWIGVVGGFAFGVWAATCAVPDQFLG
jgi:hypothetical protein